MLGTVNGYFAARATRDATGETLRYAGTPLCLALVAIEAGCQLGETLTGGDGYCWRLKDSGGGDRTPGGWWIERLAHC